MFRTHKIEKQIRETYSILVELCGALSEDEDDFVESILVGCKEYRCCHKLGFGGKFFTDSFSVEYYKEDENPTRDAIRSETNRKLRKLKERWDK